MFKRVCDFPDSSLLEHLVRLFGSEHIQKKMLVYTEKLRAFRSRTKVSDFTKACTLDSSLPQEFSILTIKIGREWHRSTLEDIEQLRQSMVQKASLTSYGIRLLQVEWDQGLLHWCIPSLALQSLVGSLDSEFLQENHVELLSINGTHLQSTQTAGFTTTLNSSSPRNSSSGSSPTPSQPKSSSSSNLLPVSPPSATGGQTGQPLSLQDQLAMVGAQVVQFKPAVAAPSAGGTDTTKQQMLSPTLMSHSHNPTPTAVQIIQPQGIPSSTSRLATLPVMPPPPPGSQQIQIIHPQIIHPNAIPGGASAMGGKHIVQPSQVIVPRKSETESPKSADGKPSLTQDGYMVMQGGPNGNSLVLVPSYVMVNSGGQGQKLAPLSSPPSSSVTGVSTPILPTTVPDRKSIGMPSQGIATLLQPGTPVSLLPVTQPGARGLPGSPMLPVTASASPVFTLAPGQSKIYENPIVSIPNPAVSSPSPRASSVTSADSPDIGRHGAQLKSLNHVCSICGNGYMWASSLKRHMHTHMTTEGTNGTEGGEIREGVEDGENITVQPKKENTCSSSSASDHSSDSASEPDDTQEMADPSQQENNIPTTVDSPGGGGGSALQEPSTGTNQESAGLPNTVLIPSGGGLPFNQLLQYVGNKDSGESGEDVNPGTEQDSSQTTSVRRFRCDECGRYLSSQAALSGHQQCMHNKQKPHVCHICNKGFFQSHSLTVHLRSHSGEKPYSCIVCNKSFSQRSSLNIHIRTHSGERPYQCPFCSRGFSDSSTLAKHRRTHTGERPYQCRECGASFSQSGNLWRHMKQVHPSAAVTT